MTVKFFKDWDGNRCMALKGINPSGDPVKAAEDYARSRSRSKALTNLVNETGSVTAAGVEYYRCASGGAAMRLSGRKSFAENICSEANAKPKETP